ncbi:MAG TPA: hypothetical protein VGH52_09485 [Gaiellaceae bacterium]
MGILRQCCVLVVIATVSFVAVEAFTQPEQLLRDVAAAPTVTLRIPSAAMELASLRIPLPKHAAKKNPSVATTPSRYEYTTDPATLQAQGCAAGAAKVSGLVVLDFGQQVHFGEYGAYLFSKHFASNTQITTAMEAYATGYAQCLPKHSAVHINLARGTSNYNILVPSAETAGKLWAAEVNKVGAFLKQHHFTRITSAAAIDAEPAYDKTFTKTHDFFYGFAEGTHRYLLYNYGSLDGGVDSYWSLEQAYYVAGGMRQARAIPEIYNLAMAQEWAELAKLSVVRHKQPIKLAGVMTQYQPNCKKCGYKSSTARHVLRGELAAAKVPSLSLDAVTNIGSR